MKPKEEEDKIPTPATARDNAIFTLQRHVEDMRSIVQCKICLKPLYEPYMLGCGHTYCYSCLNNWFNGNGERRRNKNCPDCRAIVKAQPAPNYLLRDLTHMLIGHAELLPEDETVDEHKRDKEDEADVLAGHRAGQGLFQGIFKTLVHIPHPPPLPIHDLEDGVERCPVCAWEIEDGRCTGCGLSLDSEADIDFSDVDISDEDEDVDVDADEDDESTSSEEGDGQSVDGVRPADQHPPPQAFYGLDSEDDDDDDDNDEDDSRYDDDSVLDRYDSHDDFIDNENEDDMDDMDGMHGYGYPSDAATPYSDGTELTGQDGARHSFADDLGLHHGLNTPYSTDGFSDIDEDASLGDHGDDSVRPHGVRIAPARRMRRVVSDDEEDIGVEVRPWLPGPLPQRPDMGLAGSSATDGSPPARSSAADEAEDSESATTYRKEDSDNSEEESDDTAIPPQTGRARRRRLEHQRTSRPPRPYAIRITGSPSRSRNYGGNLGRSGRRNRQTPVY